MNDASKVAPFGKEEGGNRELVAAIQDEEEQGTATAQSCSSRVVDRGGEAATSISVGASPLVSRSPQTHVLLRRQNAVPPPPPPTPFRSPPHTPAGGRITQPSFLLSSLAGTFPLPLSKLQLMQFQTSSNCKSNCKANY